MIKERPLSPVVNPQGEGAFFWIFVFLHKNKGYFLSYVSLDKKAEKYYSVTRDKNYA